MPRLSPPPAWPGLERGHQPVARLPRRPLEGLGQVLHRLVGHHDVGLGGVAAPHDHLPLPPRTLPPAPGRTDPPAGPVERARAGEARGVARARRPSRPAGPAAWCRSASRCGAPLRRWRPAPSDRDPARRRRCCPGSAWRRHPRRPGAHGTMPPTLGNFDWTATPRSPGDGIVGHDAVGVGELLEVGGGDDGLLGGECGRTCGGDGCGMKHDDARDTIRPGPAGPSPHARLPAHCFPSFFLR